MRYVFLLNRFSLKKKLNSTIDAISSSCEELSLDYKIEINDENTSTEDLVKKYQKEKVVLMAVGGDGTLNRVLNAMIGTKNILGLIPNGTGNDFYKTIQESYSKGIHYLDLIQMNDSYFINVACFGIDADIGNNDTFVHSKWIPEKHRYNMGILYHFITFKPRKMRVKIQKNTIEKECMTIVVCNSKYYGGGYKVGYTSSPEDGKIEVYIVEKMKKSMMIYLTKGMNKGLHEKSKYTTKISCKELTIESDTPIESNMDGECRKNTKFTIKCIPKGIKFYYNPDLIQKFQEKLSK